MKKFIALLLALTMVLSMAACGESKPAASLDMTLDEAVNSILTEQPVEFMGGAMPVDLTDTSEDGLYFIRYYTGLENADQLKEISAYEPMMGSIAFSLVLVRVNDGVDTKSVAESMKAGIDTRKWICVEANDLLVAGYGDVVMLIMLDNTSGMTAQSFVDAFQTVCGADLDFTI